MGISKIGQRFGTALIQQLIQISCLLTPIKRFSYLQASLRGSAVATINGLSLSSANYEAAVALLKKRYGDPQKLINPHMDALVNLPIVENIRDLKAMRHLYDEVEANL